MNKGSTSPKTRILYHTVDPPSTFHLLPLDVGAHILVPFLDNFKDLCSLRLSCQLGNQMVILGNKNFSPEVSSIDDSTREAIDTFCKNKAYWKAFFLLKTRDLKLALKLTATAAAASREYDIITHLKTYQTSPRDEELINKYAAKGAAQNRDYNISLNYALRAGKRSESALCKAANLALSHNDYELITMYTAHLRKRTAQDFFAKAAEKLYKNRHPALAIDFANRAQEARAGAFLRVINRAVKAHDYLTLWAIGKVANDPSAFKDAASLAAKNRDYAHVDALAEKAASVERSYERAAKFAAKNRDYDVAQRLARLSQKATAFVSTAKAAARNRDFESAQILAESAGTLRIEAFRQIVQISYDLGDLHWTLSLLENLDLDEPHFLCWGIWRELAANNDLQAAIDMITEAREVDPYNAYFLLAEELARQRQYELVRVHVEKTTVLRERCYLSVAQKSAANGDFTWAQSFADKAGWSRDQAYAKLALCAAVQGKEHSEVLQLIHVIKYEERRYAVLQKISVRLSMAKRFEESRFFAELTGKKKEATFLKLAKCAALTEPLGSPWVKCFADKVFNKEKVYAIIAITQAHHALYESSIAYADLSGRYRQCAYRLIKRKAIKNDHLPQVEELLLPFGADI
eukprot:TRINITY_DN13044_c0_g1_i1.p1 TRINITY_DN13044_c0_g1~~TRINITY_DN13044_c0_g1_i1.p1  ORF type:complete len:643 (+),score=133.03 TRINITY_DN13044_c0_g1_i1:28-1929(+)